MQVIKAGYFRTLKQKLLADIDEVPQIVSGPYFPALDGLRAVAVLIVIFYHFGLNHYLRPYHILINGDFGVDIFFVISGFLITTLLLKEKITHHKIDLRRFLIRRILRVIPVAYLFLLALVVLNVAYHFGLKPSNFAASFLFYKNLPFQFEPYSGHFWSLAAEVQFYLIFPILLALNVNRYMWFVLTIVLVVPLISILGYYHFAFLEVNPVVNLITKITMYSFWNGPYTILIGSLFSVFLFKGVILLNGKTNYFLSALLFLTALIITSKAFMFYTPYVSEIVASVLVAYAILLDLKISLLGRILAHPALVKTGIISYSLYIWQQPFLGIHTWQPWMHAFSAYPLWLLIIVRLIIVFALASASYYFIERRFLKLKTRYR